MLTTLYVSEAPWGTFVSRSALLLGVASLALMGVFVGVLGFDDSTPYAELQMAGHNAAAYRIGAALDIATWLGIGGLLLAFAGCFAARAPIRALLLACCGVGQVVGALGGAVRLNAIGELASRYAAATPDQQAALGQAYLTLAQVMGAHYGIGQLLYGIGYLLIAALAFSHVGLPRWIAAWFAVSGTYAVAN
jgi:hypothetical protein